MCERLRSCRVVFIGCQWRDMHACSKLLQWALWEDWFCGRFALMGPRSGELRMQKLKSHLVRTQSLNVLPFTPGVGQYMAIHATLTARDFFLAYFYPSCPFTCISSKTSPDFFLCWVPAAYKQAQKTWLVEGWWLVKQYLTWSYSNVCVQPWCDPLWLTGLKAPTN